MAWGSKTNLTQLTSITTEQFFDAVTLNPGELADCYVKIDFPASPTDEATVNVYTTLDDSSEQWSTIPYRALGNVGFENDPNILPFTISGCYKFRVGVQRDGSTDTITSADMSYRKDGVNL